MQKSSYTLLVPPVKMMLLEPYFAQSPNPLTLLASALLWNECLCQLLPAPPPPDSYVEALIPNVMVSGGRMVGWPWSMDIMDHGWMVHGH